MAKAVYFPTDSNKYDEKKGTFPRWCIRHVYISLTIVNFYCIKLASYYHKFIKAFAEKAHSLTSLR